MDAGTCSRCILRHPRLDQTRPVRQTVRQTAAVGSVHTKVTTGRHRNVNSAHVRKSARHDERGSAHGCCPSADAQGAGWLFVHTSYQLVPTIVRTLAAKYSVEASAGVYLFGCTSPRLTHSSKTVSDTLVAPSDFAIDVIPGNVTSSPLCNDCACGRWSVMALEVVVAVVVIWAAIFCKRSKHRKGRERGQHEIMLK